MGQQQLLLIVLAVIIAGIALLYGLLLFQSSAVDANRNAVIADLHHLGYLAHSYYKRPTSFGGGNGLTFAGFQIAPPSLLANANGTYSISTPGTAGSVVIQGIGIEIGEDGINPIKYQLSAVSTTVIFTLAKLN